MDNLVIASTHKTPKVFFDAKEGIFEMSGRSIPEDSESFFRPIIEWLDSFIRTNPEKIIFNFNFEYFNTSTSKWLITIYKRIDLLYEQNQNIEVNWYYTDDDLKEYGEEIKDMVLVPFKLICADV